MLDIEKCDSKQTQKAHDNEAKDDDDGRNDGSMILALTLDTNGLSISRLARALPAWFTKLNSNSIQRLNTSGNDKTHAYKL